MINSEKQTNKQLAVQRANYIKKLRISVKASQKTQDQDQLIVIQTFNTHKKQSVELIMRKLSQLDYFIEYLCEKYGGHIIPVLKSDFFFQSNLNMTEIVPKIQEYLADLQQNKYCRQQQKFYCFILEQNMNFPTTFTYNKVLNNATDFSRKYLSSLFVRKALPELSNTQQYVSAHSTFVLQCHKYESIRQITILKIKEILQIEQIVSLFADISTISPISIQPHQIQIEEIWKMIKVSDKLINQAGDAHGRWEILIEHTRQLENNVCKGLHEDSLLLQQKKGQVKTWNDSLSYQFLDLCDYLCDKMQLISKKLKIIYQSVIEKSHCSQGNSEYLKNGHQRIRKSIEQEIRLYQEKREENQNMRKSSTDIKSQHKLQSNKQIRQDAVLLSDDASKQP